jgi:broad specificity phosphatase PhoE
MLELWLVRHGQTEWNINRRFQGSSDIPLNDFGKTQAEALAPRLRSVAWSGIYASDLARAYETATIALGDDAPITADARLQEIYFGKFEGLTWDEIKATYPEEFAGWVNNRNNNTHGGERSDDVVVRVQAFLDDIQNKHTSAIQGGIQPNNNEPNRVLIVSHGGIIGIMCALLVGTNPQEWWRYRLHNTSITRFELHKRGAILVYFNDDHHTRQSES